MKEIFFLAFIRCIFDMCALYMNKYRIGSKRLKGYDYTSPGKYFITICTKNKIPYFGKIENGEMELSPAGEIAEKFWLEIPDHFPLIELDEFIIMPNHMHGIIIIRESDNKSENHVQTPKLSNVQTPNLGVCTGPIKNEIINSGNPYWKSNSIGSIINQYKRICTITIRKNGYPFAWHSRYYDHVIRNNHELSRIRKYIRENPQKWIDKKIPGLND